jgi:transcription antitermination factor NusG
MSTGNQALQVSTPAAVIAAGMGSEAWFAIHTRARHERVVAQRLEEQGVNAFLPTVTEVHRWSDSSSDLGLGSVGTPIADSQIDAVRALVGQKLPWSDHPFLQIGKRVRVRGGSLDGVEGILVARNSDSTLVISVDAIQRSLAVRIQGYDVELI